jgi:hypothetical protein
MIVHDLHLESVALAPPEAYAPLVIHPNAPLTFAIPGESLQLITRRNPEVRQCFGCIQDLQLSLHPALDIAWKPSGAFATENLLGPFVGKAPDHRLIITSYVNNVKR